MKCHSADAADVSFVLTPQQHTACASGTDLLRHFYLLQFYAEIEVAGLKSLSHPVTVYRHRTCHGCFCCVLVALTLSDEVYSAELPSSYGVAWSANVC